MLREHAPVCIVGAGPAGLLLSLLLSSAGIECMVLEHRSRSHVESRVRAGLLESRAANILRDAGAAFRMDAEALPQPGLLFRVNDASLFRVPIDEITGSTMCIYGQAEIVKDLISIHSSAESLLFETRVLGVHASTTGCSLDCIHLGQRTQVECEFVVGCDGSHSITRQAVRGTSRDAALMHDYRLTWTGILARTPPHYTELLYSVQPSGFALHSMRTPNLSRLYLQTPPDSTTLTDSQIWKELSDRLYPDGSKLLEGAILERVTVPIQTLMSKRMSAGRIFLAGDSAHVTPPSAAKGLNLALEDAQHLARALISYYHKNDDSALREYSDRAIRRAWQAQQFSHKMTWLFHSAPTESDYVRQLRERALLDLSDDTSERYRFAMDYSGLSRTV
jgi:p-hydroxybenzoate 3-monooxygenase